MKHFIHRFLLFAGLALLSAFTLVPPAHQIPEGNRFVPEVGYQKPPVDALTLNTSGGTVAPAGEICVAVTGKGFKDIISMQYSLNWDANVLKFKRLQNFGLEKLTDNNFGAHLADEGTLTHSWYDHHLLGVTKPDGFTLYEICFEAIGGAGSETKLTFTSKPTVVEIANAASIFLDLRSENEVVKIR